MNVELDQSVHAPTGAQNLTGKTETPWEDVLTSSALLGPLGHKEPQENQCLSQERIS